MCQQSVTCVHCPSSCSFLGLDSALQGRQEERDILPTPGPSFPLALLGLGMQALDNCSCRNPVANSSGREAELLFPHWQFLPCTETSPAGTRSWTPWPGYLQNHWHAPLGIGCFPSLQGVNSECPQSQPDPRVQSLLEGPCPSSRAASQVLPFAAFPC